MRKHVGITIQAAARRLGQGHHLGRRWVRHLMQLGVLERVGRRRVDAFSVASLRCYRDMGRRCWCGMCGPDVTLAPGIHRRERATAAFSVDTFEHETHSALHRLPVTGLLVARA